MQRQKSPAAFTVSIETEGTTVRAALRGELDIAAVSTLEQTLRNLEAVQPRRLVIDLRGLGFMDAMGLGVILAANERARMGGFELALIPAADRVQRLFAITQTRSGLNFVEPDAGKLAPLAG